MTVLSVIIPHNPNVSTSMDSGHHYNFIQNILVINKVCLRKSENLSKAVLR